MIGRFLRDRLALVLLFPGATLAILTLAGLLLSYEGLRPDAIWSNLGYGLLLAGTMLTIYLIVDFVRWYPFARQVEALLQNDVGLEALANLPRGAGHDQAAFRDLLLKLYRLSVAERLSYQEAHQRHLAFMNLWVHQMKTPVSAIHLIAQQAGHEDPTAALLSVEEEAAKLAEGLDLVLNMARLQDFALDLHIERVDLLQAVRAVINSRKKQFIRLGIFPEVHAADDDWTILTDAKWHGVILDQILSNALKYGAQAGRAGQRVTFRLERHDRTVSLTIADQGPGIPPQDLDRVFDPFFTGENGRRYVDATGIGLYMVRQLSDRLGHDVRIASEAGAGTAVTVTYGR